MTKSEYIVALDIGSFNIRTVIAQLIPQGKPRIVGVGSSPSQGMRRGMVVDLEEVSQSIRASVEDAERNSGIKVDSVVVSIGGNHIKCAETKGVIAIGRADGEVTEEDVARVEEAAQAVNLHPNQEILHIIPQNYKLDDQEGINDPVGMNGVRLEMKGLLITGSTPHLKNISKCIYNAGLAIEGFIVTPLAAAKAVLNKRQKELGVVLVDIGAGTTSMAVFEERELIHVAVLPVGASHITNDIAIGLRTSIEVAEKIKIGYGSALPNEIDKKDLINLAQIDDQEEGSISRKHVAEIIEARLEEIFIYVEKELKKIGRSALLPAGIVITGGGARLQGSVDLAKDILKLPAQTGFPVELSGLIDKVDGPEFSVAVGTILWELDNDEHGQGSSIAGNKSIFSGGKEFIPKFSSLSKGSLDEAKKWLRKFLP